MGRKTNREKPVKKLSREVLRRFKLKGCYFCKTNAIWVDYKDVNLLKKYTSDRGKIRNRRTTGVCQQHQKDVSNAVKNARELMLLPYAQKGAFEKSTRPERRPKYTDSIDEFDISELQDRYADIEDSEFADELEAKEDMAP
jgi:small subunit ribosomal protein S18